MVHPDCRRRGIGSRLLDEAMRLCRDRGFDKLLLVAPRSSPGARFLARGRHGSLGHSEYSLDLIGSTTQGPTDSTLHLRPATRDDVADVTEILAAAFGESSVPLPLDSAEHSTLVAEREGVVVATLRVHLSNEEWGIYGFAVAPVLQGRGIGRDVLRRVCHRAEQAGVARIHLEVEVENNRALSLYTSLGFTQSATDDYFEIPL